MIDFKIEVEKYKPVLEVEQVESSVQSDEMQDIMDLLQHMVKNKATKE